MIQVTELRGQSRIVNADLIEFIEAAPDTQLVMRDGRRVLVGSQRPEELALALRSAGADTLLW